MFGRTHVAECLGSTLFHHGHGIRRLRKSASLNILNRVALKLGVLTILGASGVANAVHLADSGLGQALIFPYYTVRNGSITTITVVNHTDRAKALKVRFLEGKASKEVLDFNLYLSPHDQWAAAIGQSVTSGGTLLYVADKSCSTPAIPAKGVEFRNYAYVQDAIGGTLDRTREGYAEIIEMADFLPGSPSEIAVTHVAGSPANCSSLTADTVPRDIVVGSGGLSGQGYIINSANGTSFGYTATALDNFSKNHPIWFEPGSINPNLTHVNPKISYVFDRRVGLLITEWATGNSSAPVDPVSAVLSRASLLNTYSTNTTVGATSSWVVTFPTKGYYFRGNVAAKLFPSTLSANGSCVPVSMEAWNAEEGLVSAQVFAGITQNQICWESSVLNFGASAALGVGNAYRVAVDSNADGNARLKFGTGIGLSTNGAITTIVSPSATAATRTNVVFAGLPALGFQVNRLGDINKPYPSLYDHRGDVEIK